MPRSVWSKLFVCFVVVGAWGLVGSAQAQTPVGSGNNVIGTVGDMPAGKVNRNLNNVLRGPNFGLNFSTLGLFGDAEPFDFNFNRFNPIIVPLPDITGAGVDFTDVSFDEYMQTLADRFNLPNADAYKSFFLAQNEFTVTNGGTPLFFLFGDLQQQFFSVNPAFQSFLIPTLNDEAFERVHEQAFQAGGGFLEFDPPITPTLPADKFEPFPNDGTIGPDGKPFVPFPSPSVPVSASGSGSTAANVAVVPEPAALALLTLGTGVLLARRRR